MSMRNKKQLLTVSQSCDNYFIIQETLYMYLRADLDGKTLQHVTNSQNVNNRNCCVLLTPRTYLVSKSQDMQLLLLLVALFTQC